MCDDVRKAQAPRISWPLSTFADAAPVGGDHRDLSAAQAKQAVAAGRAVGRSAPIAIAAGSVGGRGLVGGRGSASGPGSAARTCGRCRQEAAQAPGPATAWLAGQADLGTVERDHRPPGVVAARPGSCLPSVATDGNALLPRRWALPRSPGRVRHRSMASSRSASCSRNVTCPALVRAAGEDSSRMRTGHPQPWPLSRLAGNNHDPLPTPPGGRAPVRVRAWSAWRRES